MRWIAPPNARGWFLSTLTAFSLLGGLPKVAPGAVPEPPRKISSVEGITEYKLANGLRVLLFPEPTRPKVTVNLTIFVGSRNEGYGETGMAHLLEHMLFKGTPTHPDIPGLMKLKGADFNGTTWVDRTNYYETLTASDENLEFAIKLEADRMIHSRVRAEDLATEFSVVRNEFEMGENSPQNVLEQRMMAVAYEWHNYGKSTIGNRTDIERVPIESLRDFYKKYYQTDNAMLVVAGKFDEKKALEYIAKYFGSIPKPERALPKTYTEEPPQDGERVVTLRRVGDVGLVGLLYHIPAGSHAEFPAVEVLSNILDSEPSGRLYKALVETKKASSVSTLPYAFRDPGAFLILSEVNTKELAPLEKVRDVMLSVLDEVGKKGVTTEEVDRAKRKLLKDRELAAADPNRIAIELSEWAAQGDWRLYFLHRDHLEKVTPEQVRQVAANYLTPSNRTVGYFVPSAKPERTPVPLPPDVTKLVEGYKGRKVESAGEAFDVDPLAIEARIKRPEPIEGVRIALLPKKTRGGSVHVRVALHYGDAESLKGRMTAADFLPGLMLRGTKALTRQQIQDTLDKNLARLNAGGGSMLGGSIGSLSFTIETKKANLATVLDVLRQVLREPTLPSGEFDVMKHEELASLEQGRTDPQSRAFTRFRQLMAHYAKDDVRYVPTIEEEIERVKDLKLEDVQALYREFIGSQHGELAIVGDFEASEVLPVLAKTFDGWKSAKPFVRVPRPAQTDLKPERETIEIPDKENAIFLAGELLPLKDTDPDYPALTAGNFILGGGALSSRIADRLRQKGGLSYGAGSYFIASPLDPRSDMIIMAIYNPKNVDKVIEGVNDEIAKLLKDGVTAKELEDAKAGYLKQEEVERTSDPALAATFSQNLFLGRTMKHDAEIEEKIRKLTVEEVNSALRKHLDPKKFSVVTAGSFARKK